MSDLILNDQEDLINEEDAVSNHSQENLSEIINPYRIECSSDYFEATSDPCEREKLHEVENWDFPESYRTYTKEEEKILKYVENFYFQYSSLYPEAQHLHLTPYNECNVKKFVSLTVVPTLLKYSELFMWEDCSKFVSNFLSLELLPCPYKLPRTLFSPNTVLTRQCGNSFEYSTVLCSLLLGAGYDAYVVSGYATRELCQVIEIHKEIELKQDKKISENVAETLTPTKYMAKSSKTLSSQYLKSQLERDIARKQKEQEETKANEKKLQKEKEMPENDTLYGYRVHSWILICAGKRQIDEPFFIDPLTGNGKSVHDLDFLGIESLWNDKNYWICIQKGRDGIGSLKFDLTDTTVWEQIFPSDEDISTTQISDEMDEDIDDIVEEEKPKTCRVRVPKSWCNQIELDLTEYKTHNKNYKRIRYHNRKKIETFTSYSMEDGLMQRITEFSDYEQNNKILVEENYENRIDKLHKMTKNYEKGLICEFFESGRKTYLKEHEYGISNGISKQIMRFYNKGRLDCLKTREIGSFEITELYEGRDDNLFYRKVEFVKKTIKFHTPENEEIPPQIILKINEKFSRNKEIDADKDIADLIFDFKVNKIYVKYHVREENIFASTHIFVKNSSPDEKVSDLYFDEDMHISFNPKTSFTEHKTSKLYELLLSLVQHENQSKSEIYDSEKEIKFILKARKREKAKPEFTTSHFDLLRSKDIKKIRMDMEEAHMREIIRKKQIQSDYLGPYLAVFDDPATLTAEQAIRIRELCLADVKTTLVKQANYIQSRFEQQTEELKKKQKWYQNNQITLSKEEEVNYIKYCSDAMFRINIFEKRLQMHKRKAITKYKNMIKRLDADPRLSV